MVAADKPGMTPERIEELDDLAAVFGGGPNTTVPGGWGPDKGANIAAAARWTAWGLYHRGINEGEVLAWYNHHTAGRQGRNKYMPTRLFFNGEHPAEVRV